jgi:ribosome-binding factor A
MGAPDRMTRVNELLKREIADIIEREYLGGDTALISVTAVSTSHDLRLATVKISVFGGDADFKKKIIRTLRNMHGDIQKKISKRVTLKYTPVLGFELDLNVEGGDRVLAMLEEMDDELD